MRKIWLLIIVIEWCLVRETTPIIAVPNRSHFLDGAIEPISAVLAAASEPHCSVILMADGTTTSFSAKVAKELDQVEAPKGIGVFDLTVDVSDTNETSEVMKSIIPVARKLRKISWCVIVIVMSEDPFFLMSFAELSLQQRLFVWTTKLLVVTRMEPSYFFEGLLKQYWTFSMMNTMFLNLEENVSRRWNVYSYLPYSPEGAKVFNLAVWTKSKGLRFNGTNSLFPEKYWDFHGSLVQTTNIPYIPLWREDPYTKPDGTQGKMISGMDGLLWNLVAEALNFTYVVLPVKDWAEVLDLVEARKSFASPIAWDVMPERLERHDMTYVYTWLFVSFSLKSPSVLNSWQNIFYPLAYEVWIAILGCLLITPGILVMISNVWEDKESYAQYGVDMAILDMLGIFLGENLMCRLPKTNSGRTLMAVWLLFSVIIGASYSGNLKANLTLPKYPSRVETLEELVETVDKVLGPTYFSESKEFFLNSENEAYKKLGSLMVIATDDVEWMMEQALHDKRVAMVDFLKHMEFQIADKYTRPDGTTKLYIGRTSINSAPSVWLVPHDAPYIVNFDKYMQAAVEAGLYEKWSRDEIAKTRIKIAKRRREYREKMDREEITEVEETDDVKKTEGIIKALSLTHMQGAFLLHLIGLTSGLLAFILEWLKLYHQNK